VTGFSSDPLEALRLVPGAKRPRRLRRTPGLRDLVRETTLAPDDLVHPLFVVPGAGVRRPVASMPGVDQLSVDLLGAEARELAALGIKAVLLFGIPSEKDPVGLESHAEDGVAQQAIRALKEDLPELVVMTDVCLCEYTDHGHCGLVGPDGEVLNDETLEVLGRIAVSHGDAGADVVAPSGFVDQEERNFELLPGAAAIDLGAPPGYPASDIVGETRPLGDAPADESALLDGPVQAFFVARREVRLT